MLDECFLFAIDNGVHAHPGFDVSFIIKLLRNWDRGNGHLFLEAIRNCYNKKHIAFNRV